MQQWVCSRCGRSTAVGSQESVDWLIGLPRSGTYQEIRCPKHITEWALRNACYPRTKQIRKWAAMVAEKHKDDEDMPMAMYPYAIDDTTIERLRNERLR